MGKPVEAGRDDAVERLRQRLEPAVARPASDRTAPRTADCRRCEGAGRSCTSLVSTGRSSIVATKRLVSLSDRGGSEIVSALGLPPAQSGLRSRSSGRVVARTRRGTPLTRSRSSSTKSSRAASAQWRSSKTSTRGRSSASASRNCRQAVNVSPRRSARSGLVAAEADEQAQVRRDPVCFGRVVEDATNRCRELALHLRRRVTLQDPRLRLDDLPERPEADAVPVRERAALAPGHTARRAGRRLPAAARRAATCRCRERPGSSRAAATVRTQAHSSRSWSNGELPLAADERRPSGARGRRPGPASGRIASQTLIASLVACDRDRRRLPVLDRVARRAEGLTVDENHVRGGGVLGGGRPSVTTWPTAIGSRSDAEAPGVTRASPVATAMRTCGPLALVGQQVADAQRGADRALWIVLVRRGGAEHRHGPSRR